MKFAADVLLSPCRSPFFLSTKAKWHLIAIANVHLCDCVNINETAGPLVLMVTQVGCDVLIDLGGVSFRFHMNSAAR